MNRVVLIGNVGKDPEIRYAQSGMAICNFSIATTKTAKGEKKTSWHNILCFDKTAENVSKYVSKGSKVAVSGEIQYSEWEKDGQKHYKTEILANEIEFLGSKSDGQASSRNNQPPAASRQDGYAGQGHREGYDIPDSGEIPF